VGALFIAVFWGLGTWCLFSPRRMQAYMRDDSASDPMSASERYIRSPRYVAYLGMAGVVLYFGAAFTAFVVLRAVGR